jgi:peroxiredoxin
LTLIGVYGVGYLLAAGDPLRHWPIVLVGLMGKVLGPIGFAWSASSGNLPWLFGWTILTNDLIWWVPFGLILRAAWQDSLRRQWPAPDATESGRDALSSVRSQRRETLFDLSQEAPVLAVFLRHSGCTFCREALADLSSRRAEIEAAGVRLALVHMGDNESAGRVFARYGLEDVDRFSDPQRRLYRAFGLMRANFWQLFGPKVWWRGFQAAVLARHGLGKLVGDGFQMPGAFLIYRGNLLVSFRHRTAADRPDYVALACDLTPVNRARPAGRGATVAREEVPSL